MQPLTLIDKANDRIVTVWDGRLMRSLADALEQLRVVGKLSADDRAEIRTMPIRLPGGRVTSIVSMIGAAQSERVAMPSSASFRATGTFGERQEHDISDLNGATCDAEGNVELQSGAHVHNVELIPTRMHHALTPLEKRIVGLTIAFLQAEDRCWRSADAELLPDFIFLDFSVLPSLTLPSLKTVERYITQQLPAISRQTIANALAHAGMRLPRSGKYAA